MVAIQAGAWHSDAVPGLPSNLWTSTLFLLAVSVALEWGRQQIRQNRSQGLYWMLWLSIALAIGFLANQTRVWLSLDNIRLPANARTLYAFSFAVLTGLHAVHVLGGFAPLFALSAPLANAIPVSIVPASPIAPCIGIF
jgi:heme/copper-type cytochrome/quinol oxidase subunit 3